MKLIGLLMIVLAGIGVGLYASACLKRRAASFERLDSLIGYMETQIRYSAAPISEVIAQAAQGGEFDSLTFLVQASRLISRGQPPETALAIAVKKYGEESCLNKADRELLLQFGRGLGKSDLEGQLAHCASYRRLIADRLQTARGEAAAKGRLYLTLGIAGGLSLALLLL